MDEDISDIISILLCDVSHESSSALNQLSERLTTHLVCKNKNNIHVANLEQKGVIKWTLVSRHLVRPTRNLLPTCPESIKNNAEYIILSH